MSCRSNFATCQRRIPAPATVEPGQFERGLRQVLERQCHLEQRVARLRTHRVEHLDEPLERHVGVAERLQIRLPAPARADRANDSPGSTSVRSTRVLTNMPIRSSSAASPRPAIGVPIGDVVGAGQPRQQHRQRSVHHHEQRRALRARPTLDQPAHAVAASIANVSTAPRHDAIAGRGRSAGQVQLIGQVGERFAPVVDLLRGNRLRIVLGTENLTLPQRVVGVLHRQRRPRRGLAAGARASYAVITSRVNGPIEKPSAEM